MGITPILTKNVLPSLSSIKIPPTRVFLSRTQSKNAVSILSQFKNNGDPADRLERRIGLRREEVDRFDRIENAGAAGGALKIPHGVKARQRAQDIFGIPTTTSASPAKAGGKSSQSLAAFANVFNPQRENVSLHPLLTPSLHFEQRNTGNCYMLAALYSALQSPQGRAKLCSSTLEKQISHDGAVTYHFQFPTGLSAEMQETELGQNRAGKNPAKAPWLIQAMELAYAKGVRNYRNQQRPLPYPNGGAGHTFKLVGGGHPANALLDMIGGEKVSRSLKGKNVSELLTEMSEDKEFSYILTIGTPSFHNGSDQAISYTLKSGQTIRLPLKHAYTLLPDAESKTVTIIDPHDTKNKRYVLDYEALPHLFQSIEGVKLPKL